MAPERGSFKHNLLEISKKWDILGILIVGPLTYIFLSQTAGLIVIGGSIFTFFLANKFQKK